MRSAIYRANAALAATKDETPTMTDQSQARETDINVIVGRYGISGTAPGAKGQPITGDFSELPQDLRGMIEKARELDALREQLPPEYKHLSNDELITSSPDKLLKLTKDAETIRTRRANLPEQLKRISDQDILGWTEQQYNDMLPKPPTNTPTHVTATAEGDKK